MEDSWLAKAKKLHAIAESGLAFCEDEFDRERYEEIAILAREMLSDLSGLKVQQLENMLCLDVKRYITPQLDVRAAVIKDNSILLVKEKSDGLWTLPGGYADVGLSAAENVEKEVLEEAGIKVSADHLYAVRHKAKGDYDNDVRDFYKLFFVCNPTEGFEIKTGPETTEVGFFELENIPDLSTGRVTLRDLKNAFEAKQGPAFITLFD